MQLYRSNAFTQSGGYSSPRASFAYILYTSAHCLRLFWQLERRADSRARASAGSNIAAKIPMMAITTSSSISVNPFFERILLSSLLGVFHVDLPALVTDTLYPTVCDYSRSLVIEIDPVFGHNGPGAEPEIRGANRLDSNDVDSGGFPLAVHELSFQVDRY